MKRSSRATARWSLGASGRAAWELRIALLVALAAGLGAMLAATYAAFEELGSLPVAVGGSLALLGLAIGLLHIRSITRERRHHALLEALVVTFASPRDIEGTASAAARLLVEGRRCRRLPHRRLPGWR